mgnify:FL=1
MWDEGALWYFAPIEAMTLNDNCVIIHVLPGFKSGRPTLVRIEPPTEYLSVEVEAITVRANSGQNRLKVQ